MLAMLRYTFGSSKRKHGIYSNEKMINSPQEQKYRDRKKKGNKKLSSSESQHLQIG